MCNSNQIELNFNRYFLYNGNYFVLNVIITNGGPPLINYYYDHFSQSAFKYTNEMLMHLLLLCMTFKRRVQHLMQHLLHMTQRV